MSGLVLKRGKFSRSSGQRSDNDFDVLADGKVVGRILEEGSRFGPPELQWSWSITVIVPATPGVTNGTAATPEEAKAKFRAAWEKAMFEAVAYHEAGHAIVGWALGRRVLEIVIRDDSGHATIEGTESLPLLDQVALCNAGRQSEETFKYSLPGWATGRHDRQDSINAITAEGIREIGDIDEWITRGKARARELLRQNESAVHRLAARLIECRHMDASAFERCVS